MNLVQIGHGMFRIKVRRRSHLERLADIPEVLVCPDGRIIFRKEQLAEVLRIIFPGKKIIGEL
jgi:hypothetical protein